MPSTTAGCGDETGGGGEQSAETMSRGGEGDGGREGVHRGPGDGQSHCVPGTCRRRAPAPVGAPMETMETVTAT